MKGKNEFLQKWGYREENEAKNGVRKSCEK